MLVNIQIRPMDGMGYGKPENYGVVITFIYIYISTLEVLGHPFLQVGLRVSLFLMYIEVYHPKM